MNAYAKSSKNQLQRENDLIVMDRVSVERAGKLLLDDISLSISDREHVAILGPNGSGKSTLLKLLLRVLYPSIVDDRAGSISILGQREWNIWELRSQLGFVSSEIDFHFAMGRSGRLTALAAVLTGFSQTELELEPDHISREMEDAGRQALQLVGIESAWQQPLMRMSTGERRRVLLARALVRRPRAIILDEPTAGLDICAQRKLLDELQQLSMLGTTIVLVTHHFHEIMPCIERTLLLDAGRLVFDGATELALASDRISRLFGCALQIQRDKSGFYEHRFGNQS